MKRTFTLLSAVLLSFAVFAAAPKSKSMLTIQSLDRGDLKVVIDGRRFEPNNNFMRLQGLKPGYHKIKVYRERNGGGFHIFGKRYEMVFNSSVTVRPRTNLTLMIDRFGRVTRKETRFDGWGNDRNNRDYDYRRNDDRRYDDRDDHHGNPGWGEDYKRGRDFEFEDDGKFGDYDWDERNAYENRTSTMSDREFERVLDAINKEWLEANKMKSATQIINTNYFTAAQVKQMLFLFSFENNRVDIAKQAYSKTVNPGNYLASLKDAFSYESSIDELARFIRNFRN